MTMGKAAVAESGMLLVDTLLRVGSELNKSAKTAMHLEQTISSLAARVSTASMEDIRDLQSMDLLRQTLEELSAFMVSLSEQVEATDLVGVGLATEKLRLADLKQRLKSPLDSSDLALESNEGLELL